MAQKHFFIGFNHYYPDEVSRSQSIQDNIVVKEEIKLANGETVLTKKFQRSSFEFYIPVVAEQCFLDGKPSSPEKVKILSTYEKEIREIIQRNNPTIKVDIDKFSDCGPGAPWPIITVILIVPPAVYYTIQIIS